MVIGLKIDCGGKLTRYELDEFYLKWDCPNIPRVGEYIVLAHMVSDDIYTYYGKDIMESYGSVIAVEWIKCPETFKISPIITIELADI